MADVDDIIDYIRSLKKGFDKDLFQSKVEELAYAVDSTGLKYDDFHTLFKVWLNLSIPYTKWVSLGSCLVPPDVVEERTVEYSLRWILTNLEDQINYSRIGFLLDWLTAAMECDAIDMTALDIGYDVFHTLLTLEVLTVHVIKLVYTLTKPGDVTRQRVLELIEYVKKRDVKKSKVRQLQVLLGLFKSYKPDCVPEDIPAVPIHTAYKKINENLLHRFKRTQERRHKSHEQHFMWINPINSGRGRNKKADPLVPNVEFFNVTSRDPNKEPLKTLKDFSDPVSLIQYSVQHLTRRPTRIRSLLCSTTGQILLAVIPDSQQAFLAHDLHHVLNSCFLELSPYRYEEKRYLLQQLAMFQRTLAQGIPVVTRFLAQYLSLWNESDYFHEICKLIEWVSVDSPEHVKYIAECLTAVYARAHHNMQQCAILRSLTNMYTNLIYSSKKQRQHFLNTELSPNNYTIVLSALDEIITRTCGLGLQVDPEDQLILYTSIQSALRRGRADLSRGITVLPSVLTLALPLLGTSGILIDHTAELMILYKLIIMSAPTRNEYAIDVLSKYMSDMLNCLYSEEILKGRNEGLIFKRIDKNLVEKLTLLVPDVNSKLSLRNHLAFAKDKTLEGVDHRDATNRIWFDTFIAKEFRNLGRFMKKALPELRNR